jgi:hypothetical protein
MLGRMIVTTLLAAGILGCATTGDEQPAGPAPQGEPATRLTGTLEGGIMAIGGETTGWVLNRPDEKPLELDVSAVRQQAEKLDGRRVSVAGRMTQRDYVERGRTPVLLVQQIREAQ